MALTKFLILRKPPSGCLEERTALIQLIVHFFKSAFAGTTSSARLRDGIVRMANGL